MRLALLSLLLLHCGSGPALHSPGRTPASERVPAAAAQPERGPNVVAEAPPAPPPPCTSAEVPVFEGGAITGSVCPRDAAAEGYTLIATGDDWTPYIFTEGDEGGRHPYRRIFLALADEQLRRVPEGYDQEKYLELFGIFPTFRVLEARLGDEERHACHEAVDNQWLERQDSTIRAWRPRPPQQRRTLRQARALERRLTRAVERDETLNALEDLQDHERHGRDYARYLEAKTQVGAIEATQAHLRGDDLLPRRRRIRNGIFGAWSARGLRDFQRRHMVVSAGFLDTESRAALARSSRENDFRALLRALRERIVDATGLIEDGSAGHAWGTVLDRDLDAPQFQFEAGREAAQNPAPDLISAATEAAAQALGFTDPAAALEALRALRARSDLDALGHVAVRLPPIPAYHASHMELRAEVDRGDVFYRYPYRDDGRPIGGRAELRPIVTLYVMHDGQETALVRWPTTIGGWKPETRPDGSVGLRYKDSPTGPRIWRDVIASPTWLPPPATPDDELVRRRDGEWEPRRSIFGPGYRSAYGLVMMMHHLVEPPRREGDEPRLIDEGIRVHGSVSYRSITRGTSHGCHRLYNHLAVRVSSFVLAHRDHVRRGRVPASYRREVLIRAEPEADGEPIPAAPVAEGGGVGLQPGTLVEAGTAGGIEAVVDVEIDTRGYLFELTPPVN
ncbi:MAG: hypothetical protein AAF645_12505, partial [Myxococcota bacterium]